MNKATSNDFGIYIVRANTIYNNTNEDYLALYPHNVRKKLEQYGGKLYVPFVFNGYQVILKGERLYSE